MNQEIYDKDQVLLLDGAMGTYYRELTKSENVSEWGNIEQPEIIKRIHLSYIEAGAKAIRTNTFGAYTLSLNVSKNQVEQIVFLAYKIAESVTDNQEILILGSLGPIYSSDEEAYLMEAYMITIDALITAGCKAFIFETFDDTKWIEKLSLYILEKLPEAVILASVAINSYGYTKSGIGYRNVLKAFEKMVYLHAYGFNCAIGAGHMKGLLSKIQVPKRLLALPNAGYPEFQLERQKYQDNSEYFGEQMAEIHQMGVGVLGGCCGTTPDHIESIRNHLVGMAISQKNPVYQTESKKTRVQVSNKFREKMEQNQFVIAVELDPPYGLDVSKLMESAHILRNTKTDIITLADSPLGRTRVDSMIMAIKIKKEVGIDVMPHICCRDKNSIAISSMIMAGYIEEIRNMLLVTGDPIPTGDKGNITSVFNVNALQLMNLANQINIESDYQDPIYIGGAFDPKRKNIDKEIERIRRKQEAGASYLLTQPIYSQKDIDVIKQVKTATNIKILAGILPLVSYKNAKFIHNEFSGMDVPRTVINQFDPEMTREEAEAVGIGLAVEIATDVKPYVDGLYFMTPFNRALMIKKIVDMIK